jgi:ADP-ribose pyrophosphatase
MAFEVVESKTVFKGRVFAVRQDRLRLPDGRVVGIDVVVHSGAVAIVPLDDEGQLWFIRNYRHPAGREMLELPAGMLEENEDPETCALREIREEIGMAAGQLRLIGQFFLAPGYSSEYMHVFLATGLYPSALEPDEDELLTVERYPLDQVWELVSRGEIQDSKTLAALFLTRPVLES